MCVCAFGPGCVCTYEYICVRETFFGETPCVRVRACAVLSVYQLAHALSHPRPPAQILESTRRTFSARLRVNHGEYGQSGRG